MEKFTVGECVHYTVPHGTTQNGIVKSINEDGVSAFVVYNCGGNWEHYMDYTGQYTYICDLTTGWIN